MKTLKALIISSLLAVSVTTPVAATGLNDHTAKMNQTLAGQIDARVLATMQARSGVASKTVLNKTPAAAVVKDSSQKTAQKSS